MTSGRGLLAGVSRVQLLVAGLVVAGGIALTAFAGSLVVAAMTAVGAVGGGNSLWLLLGLLVTVLLAGAATAATAGWLAWTVLGRLRSAAASAHRRLLYRAYRRARAFEDAHVLGSVVRPSRLFASRGDREGPLVEALKSRYVAGELDERAFERELGHLLGEGAAATVPEEIAVTAADGGDDAAGASSTDRHRDQEREHDSA